MLEFVTATQNMPFTVALVLMFGIALLEGITAFFGAALSGLIESVLPDADLSLEVSSPEYQTATPLSRLLGWLRIGQVPLLMLLVLFLTGFGLTGLTVQMLVHNASGALLPGLLAAAIALLITLPFVRLLAGLLERVMPKDETDAVSEDSLVGRVATITLGTARAGTPAEAKVKDAHGLTHYVMVAPDIAGEEFVAGSEVLLVQRSGAVFRVIANVNPVLTDQLL